MFGKKDSSIREVSHNILYDVFFNKAKLSTMFDNYMSAINDVDKSFLKKECTGVIENVDDIDKLINKYSKVKRDRLDRHVLITLRIGIYELKYLDKVPAFATIDECVAVIKKIKGKFFASYVNAVLRNVDRREKKASSIIDRKNIINKNCYFRIYNDREKTVLKELDDKKIIYNQYNGALSFEYAKVYSAKSYKDIIELNSFMRGYILISDASSIYLTDKLASFIRESKTNIDSIESTISVLDVCAAPGGKILGLIDFIHNDYSHIYAEARDIGENKIHKIYENIYRLRTTNLSVSIKDASIYDESDKDRFDVIICDVPCSGLGVVGKKPDIALHFDKEKLDSLVDLQRKILDTSAKYLKKGGIISYSTCTTTKEENENIISEFLSNNTNFESIYEKRINIDDENHADGFYMCFMKRES